MRRSSNERGAIGVSAAIWLVVFGALLLGVAAVGEATVHAARASSAADAAALAGAAAGDEAAARAAQRNGGDLVAVASDASGYRVEVRVGRVTRAAKAELVEVPWSAASGGRADGIHYEP